MRRGTLPTVLAAMALAAMGGCGGEGDEAPEASEGPPSCAGRAAETLAAFDEALQSADVEALREAWRPNHFKWFSLTRAKPGGGRRHFVAYEPAGAIRYVERNEGLPIELGGFDSGAGGRGRSASGSWVGVGIHDGRWQGRRKLTGKAEVACDEKWIKVMSLAVPRVPQPVPE